MDWTRYTEYVMIIREMKCKYEIRRIPEKEFYDFHCKRILLLVVAKSCGDVAINRTNWCWKKSFLRHIHLAVKFFIIFRPYLIMERKSSSAQRVAFTFTCDVLRLIGNGNYAGAGQVPSFEKNHAPFWGRFCYTYEYIYNTTIGHTFSICV